MAAFASSTDLQNWLQLSSINSAAATLALDIASSAIRSFCGWSISQETGVTGVLDGSGNRWLWLPTLKLTAVTSVKVNGDPLTVVTDFDWTSYGKLIHRGCWPRTARSVEVVYTHGYATVPDVVKGACLVAATLLYKNPEFVSSRSETMGPFAESSSYSSSLPGGLPVAVAEMLGPFKLEHVG